MTRKYLRRSAAQWKQLIDEHTDSQLSAKVFCTRKAVNYGSFMNWRRRLLGSQTAALPTPEQIEPDFVELTRPSANIQPLRWVVELELGDGVQLRIAKSC